jgi:hypothetical protein
VTFATAIREPETSNNWSLLEVLAVSPHSVLIVQRIRQLLDQQMRTTMSALAAPSGSPIWRAYHEREIEIHSLFDDLETCNGPRVIQRNQLKTSSRES